jgi:glycine dehydrogenase subunit 1
MNFISNTASQQKEMLAACGKTSIDQLFSDIPTAMRPRSFALGRPHSEFEVLAALEKLAAGNYSHLINFVGGGFYDHFIPAAVDDLASRSEFYTAYTPYQPEISQGTLQAIYEYQTDICRLTGMDAANASMYDGGTALFEACQMAVNITGRNRIVIDGGVNPIYRKMIFSYAANLSIELYEVPVSHGQSDRSRISESLNEKTAAVLLQNPNFFSVMDDHSDIVAMCRQKGILVVQSVYPVAMALLKTPGEIGADIAVGEGQSLGIPLSFGGPYLGFLATRMEHVRKMPGRLVGRTIDKSGREGFVLTLQAREQHIRREKAISNICSNEALCALRAHIYLSLMGTEGLKEVAVHCMAKANYARERLSSIPSVKIMDSSPTFNELTLRLPVDAGEIAGRMIERGFAAGFPLGRYYPGMQNYLLVALTEKRTRHEIGQLAEALEEAICL